MVRVFHNADFINHFRNRNDKQHPEPHNLTLVAEVDVDTLEMAYQLTNNFERSWAHLASDARYQNVRVFNVKNFDGHRSTSPGDVMEIDGRWYVVAGTSYVQLEDFTLVYDLSSLKHWFGVEEHYHINHSLSTNDKDWKVFMDLRSDGKWYDVEADRNGYYDRVKTAEAIMFWGRVTDGHEIFESEIIEFPVSGREIDKFVSDVNDRCQEAWAEEYGNSN